MINSFFDIINRQADHIAELEDVLDCTVDYLEEMKNHIVTTIEMVNRCKITAHNKYSGKMA